MKKTKQELLEERVQELNDIIGECAEAIETANLDLNNAFLACNGDWEGSDSATYILPAKYVILAFQQWQEDTRLQLIDLQKSGK